MVDAALISVACLTADGGRVRRADQGEPCPGENLLRGDVLQRGGGDYRADSKIGRCQLAQQANRHRGQASSGCPFGDAITEFRRTSLGKDQVEAADNRTVVLDQHVVRAEAGLLLGQQSIEALGEVLIELVAAIGDPFREISAVCQFEVQYSGCVLSTQPL